MNLKKLKKTPSLIVILISLMAIPITLIVFSLIRVSKTQTTFPANTTIVEDSGKFAYKNITNNFTTHFKAKATETDSIAFANNLGKISFYTPQKQIFGELNSRNTPVSKGSILTYPEIFPSVDLQYTVSSTRLLEEFIIKDKGTANKVTRIEQIAKTDLKYKENSDGSISFIQNKKTAFILPAPILYELDNKDNKSNGIKYEIEKDGSQLIITKVITSEGLAWINDPSRKYPIVIDLVIDNADTSANWVSSDPTNTVVSQETTIKQEGTGSVKVQTATDTTITVDLMEYSSDANAQTAFVTNSVIASGGTESTSGVYKIHTFTSGTNNLTFTNGGNVEVLVVAGGGGGGASSGASAGGGGGGGLVYNSSFAVTAGASTATVGEGGPGGAVNTLNNGTKGTDSVFSTITAVGGGYGGGGGKAGGAGGSGGGGGTNAGAGGGATAGQGYAGGTAQTNGDFNSGGGGGAGGVGAGSGSTGNGGLGVSSSISGSTLYYSGGGGGSSYTGASSTGGSSIGGRGGAYSAGIEATAGMTNRGGGGGGGKRYSAGQPGGSGIVIVRYPYLTLQSYTEGTIKTEGSYSLKGVAKATNSLNKTLTHTFASPLNLSNSPSASFDIRSTRTGSNIKVGIHDSGGTTTEITPNVTSANTFQTVTIDLSGVTNANKDAIDRIVITIVNADADNTFYIDNFTYLVTSLNNTITRTTTPQNLSSYNNISFWVRSTLTGQTMRFQFGESVSSEQTYDITINSANTWEKVTWDISGISAGAKDAVTLFAFKVTDATSAQTFYFDDVNSNSPPPAPTLSTSYLHDKLKTADTTPEIRFATTDPDSDDLVYQVSWDTNSAFSGATAKTSDSDAGFANITTPADTSPFTSGNTVSYTFQSALTNNVTYFYRVRVKDPSGTNTYSSWSSIRSLTIDTSLTNDQWFETMGDQFSTDTTTGVTVISNVTNDVRITASSSLDLMEYSSNANAQTAYVSNYVGMYATGGIIATASAYTIHTFNSTANFTPLSSGNVDVLVVAGGGGGSSGHSTGIGGGGGGAGGMLYNSSFAVSTGSITATVGTGGPVYTSGGNSSFSTITATGGGRGGDWSGNIGNGGSGGGASGNNAIGTGISGQGNNGGHGSGVIGVSYCTGGGGGGAGGIGSNGIDNEVITDTGGAGGIGSSNSISGGSVTYATGGRGGDASWGGTASSGAANTGNGGGGGNGESGVGGSGGSGVVIVRYLTPPILQSFSESTIKTEGTYSLKGVAKATNSLNKTLTRTIASPLNLSGFDTATFDIRSTRTGSNIKVGIHDSGGTTTEVTPNVTSANTFQTATIDLSGVTNANKDAIDSIIITIVNADSDNTFYIDNLIYYSSGNTIMSTPITATNISSTAQLWIAMQFNDEAATDIVYQVYYDVGGVPTIIPDSALTGNSTGFTTSPVDLRSLTTAAYPILYLKATLSDSSGAPILYDWGLTLNSPPNTPTLDFPADTAINVPLNALLKTTTTDDDGDDIKYKIMLCTNLAMTEACQTFDQNADPTGWSTTPYASGAQGIYTPASLFTPGLKYYWRSYAIDPTGSNTWSSTQSPPYSFTATPRPAIATNCRIEESPNDTSSNLVWTDNATNEEYYEVQRSVDGGAFSVLDTALAANTESNIDSDISDGHTYQYRVAGYFTTGPTYGLWCTTNTLTLELGTFSIKGLDLKGLILQ